MGKSFLALVAAIVSETMDSVIESGLGGCHDHRPLILVLLGIGPKTVGSLAVHSPSSGATTSCPRPPLPAEEFDGVGEATERLHIAIGPRSVWIAFTIDHQKIHDGDFDASSQSLFLGAYSCASSFLKSSFSTIRQRLSTGHAAGYASGDCKRARFGKPSRSKVNPAPSSHTSFARPMPSGVGLTLPSCRMPGVLRYS